MTANTFLSDRQKDSVNITVLGECMIELSGKPLNPLTQRFSGDTLNTAIYLRRLLDTQSCKVHYATALGTDAFSKAMLNEWQKENIDCSLVRQYEGKAPGLYYIELDQQGERSFSYWRSDSAAKQYLERDGWEVFEQKILHHQLLYLSGISLAILPLASRDKLFDMVQNLRRNGGKVAFDNNYRPLLWRNKSEAVLEYERFLSECDLALLTFDDEKQLYGEINESRVLERCEKLGVAELVIKRGAEPAIVQCLCPGQNTRSYEVSAQKVKNVIDTTAAGDSFSGAYIAARILGRDSKTAANWGHTLASTVIGHHGAIIDKKFMPEFKA